MVWLDHDRKGMETLFTNLPRHNSDHSPLTRHATVYTVEVDGDAGAKWSRRCRCSAPQLDGGATELFAVGALPRHREARRRHAEARAAAGEARDAACSATATTSRSSSMRIQVNARNRGFEFEAAPGETVLYAGPARRASTCPTSARPAPAAPARRSWSTGRVDDGWPEAPGQEVRQAAGGRVPDVPVRGRGRRSRSRWRSSSIRSSPAPACRRPCAGTRARRARAHARRDRRSRRARARRATSTPASSWCSPRRACGLSRLLDVQLRARRRSGSSSWSRRSPAAASPSGCSAPTARARASTLFGPLGKATFEPGARQEPAVHRRRLAASPA